MSGVDPNPDVDVRSLFYQFVTIYYINLVNSIPETFDLYGSHKMCILTVFHCTENVLKTATCTELSVRVRRKLKVCSFLQCSHFRDCCTRFLFFVNFYEGGMWNASCRLVINIFKYR